MAVPKKRTPSARRDRRRGNIFIKEPQLVKCKKCGNLTLPHTVCPSCGFYKGREYIDVMKKENKKKATAEQQEAKEAKEKPKKEAKKPKKEPKKEVKKEDKKVKDKKEPKKAPKK